MPNNYPVRDAYNAWRRAVDRGYGSATSQVDLERIDTKIKNLKAAYDAALEAQHA